MTLTNGTWRDTPAGRLYVVGNLPEGFANTRKLLNVAVTVDGVNYHIKEVHHTDAGYAFLLA